MNGRRGGRRREWRGARRYLDLLQVLVFALDREGRIRIVNRSACDVLGRTKAELVGRSFPDACVAAPARAEIRSVLDGLAAAEPQAVVVSETPLLESREVEILAVFRYAVLTDTAGRPNGFFLTGEVVTEQRRTAAALEASEARSEAILESAVEGIVTIDERGTIESFNPAASRIFGYEPEEVLGRNVRLLMPSPDRESHDEYLARYLATGEKRVIGLGRETIGIRKDGTEFPMELSVGEVDLPTRKLFTGLIRDLTPMKRMQEDMLRNRNLAAIGEMAASLAHEIKNPLAGISSVIQVLRDDVAADDPRRELFEELLGLVSRLDKTVKDLLIFARPWTPERRPLRISEIARHVSDGTRHDELFAGVEFRFEGATDAVAPIDPQLMEQVFWNLYLNAAQAMETGGGIRTIFEAGDGSVFVTVEDDGPGIPEEVREKAFLPFATTKSRGTGLGLAICRKILETHGGTVEILDGGGGGARIRLALPAEEAE